MNKRILLGASLLVIAMIVGGVFYLSNHSANSTTTSGSSKSQAFVGGDLHTLTFVDERLFVTGHEGAGVSTDGGRSWMPIASLSNADVMGWSKTSTAFLVGGHPGLFRSTDSGATFTKIDFYSDVSDVHSIGAVGDTIYLASPQVGLLASADGGVTWLLRNAQVGQGFMGSMLVDPTNPQRLIAPDMQAGLVTSSDGGITWTSLGGPTGAMSVAWNPTDREQIAAIGMNGGAISNDGGQTWKQLSLPPGSSAFAFSADGQKLCVATLVDVNARIFTSTDQGKNWNVASATTSNLSDAPAMDPNMPGMDHSQVIETAPQRPVAFVLGTFSLGTSAVLLGAGVLRRKDRAGNLAKKATRADRRTQK